MNSIYTLISRNRWIVPFYIFILLSGIFYATKMIYDFGPERSITFLIQPLLFTVILMISVYFTRDNKKLLLMFTSFLIWFFIEFFLYKVSPYKSYVETNGGFSYISITNNNSFKHNRDANKRIYHQQKEFTTDFTTNSFGFRGKELDSSAIKAILLGDSFVEGWGVDNDSTLTKCLERKLNCNNCIMNAGISGSDLVSAYNRVEGLTNQFKPNLLILNINPSDFDDVLIRYVAKYDGIKFMVFEFFYGSSFVFRHICHLVFELDFTLITKKHKQSLNKKTLSFIYHSLNEYDLLLDKKNIDFFILLQPFFYDLNFVYTKAELYSVDKYLQENDFKYYNAHLDLQKYANNDKLYWPIDGHFNNHGTRVYGEFIYKALSKEFNLDSLIQN